MKHRINSIFHKIIAISIMMIIVLADFSIIGINSISYASDDNIDFAVYFTNTKNEKVTNIESDINIQDLKMYVEIAVKNDGYFNGEILLKNTGFEFTGTYKSEYIKQVERNKVTLNQINVNDKALIELGIKFNNSEKIQMESLNQNGEIKLVGDYINSKDKERIEKNAIVKINWKSNENAKIELSSKVLTNCIQKVDGTNKRLIQILINSRISNNSYPIKDTDFEIKLPGNTREVKVHARSTDATNGDIDFGIENYNFNSENGILKIKLENKEVDGKINWNQDAIDMLVVTCIYDEKEDLLDKEITVNDKITTFDERELSDISKTTLQDNIDGIASIKMNSNEKSLYKGNLYTGEEREFKTITTLNVDYANVIKNIQIVESNLMLEGDNESRNINIKYIDSKINKNEFKKLFGEDGTLSILDQKEIVIKTINKDTVADENGNIVIQYPNETNKIEIRTSKPVIEGFLHIEHTKKFLNKNLTREEIKDVNKMVQKSKVSYEYNDNNKSENISVCSMNLMETSNEVNLEINRESLMATEKNEGVQIITTLLNTEESQELYKNPTVKIELPSEIDDITNVKFGLVNGRNLEINKTNIEKKDDKKIIKIQLQGEQTKYSTQTVNGTKIILQFDVILNKTSVNSESQISVYVTNEFNENAVTRTEKIKILNINPIITTNSSLEYNVKSEHNTENKSIQLDNKNKEITIKSNIINNEGTEIKEVRVIGELPTNDTQNNIGLQLKEGIDIKSKNKDQVKVYYTEKENATDDLNDKQNKWQVEKVESAKKYLLIIDNLKAKEDINYVYKVSIPNKLGEGLVASENYEVIYKDIAETEKNVKSGILTFETMSGQDLLQSVKANIEGRELENNAEAKSGEIIKYDITLENKSKKDLNGIIVEGDIPQGTTKVEYTKIMDGNDPNDSNAPDSYQKGYVEKNDKSIKFENVSIKSGEKIVLSYRVKVNDDVVDNTQSDCKISTTYDNDVKVESKISLKLRKADLVLKLLTGYRVKDDIEARYNYNYCLIIKNNSANDKNNIKIKMVPNSLLDITEVSYVYNDQTINCNNKQINNELTIDYLKAGDSIEVIITTLVKPSNNNLKEAGLYVNASDNINTYISNSIVENVETLNIDMKLTSESNSKEKDNYVTSGNKIKYTINLENTGDLDANDLVLLDKIINYATVNSIKLNGKETKYDKDIVFEGENNYSLLKIAIPLKVGEKALVEIETTINKITTDTPLGVTNHVSLENNISESEEKLIKIVAEFLGKHVEE